MYVKVERAVTYMKIFICLRIMKTKCSFIYRYFEFYGLMYNE